MPLGAARLFKAQRYWQSGLSMGAIKD